MGSKIKRALKWLGLGIVAVIVFMIDLALNRRKGYREGKAEAEAQAEIERVKEAAKRGDTDTIDEAWKRGR